MVKRRVKVSDLEGIPLVSFGDDLNFIETARDFRDANTHKSIENINYELEYRTLLLNMLLVGRLDRKVRDPIIKAITEVNALTAFKVMMEYEQAYRTVRVEASKEVSHKKGVTSRQVTWTVIEEHIKNNGRRPYAGKLFELVKAKREELGLNPLSQHQTDRHLAAWRKANPTA